MTSRNRTAQRQVAPRKAATSTSTRERIFAAAQQLFAERGYGNVSMPAIAHASGITPGAIYKHFASKEDLFFEAVALRVVEARAVAGAGTSDPAIDLPRAVAAYTTARLKLLRQLSVEIHAASIHNAKVRRLLQSALDGNVAQLRELIVYGQERGTLAPSIDASLLASAVMVFLMGLMHMETLLPGLVGNRQWHDFVAGRVAAMLGAR